MFNVFWFASLRFLISLSYFSIWTFKKPLKHFIYVCHYRLGYSLMYYGSYFILSINFIYIETYQLLGKFHIIDSLGGKIGKPLKKYCLVNLLIISLKLFKRSQRHKNYYFHVAITLNYILGKLLFWPT